MSQRRLAFRIFPAAVLLLMGLLAGCRGSGSSSASSADMSSPTTASELPADAPELVRRGKLVFDQTPRYAAAYVGNKLACADCHVQSGTASYAAPMIDLANLFPMFNKRAGRVISLQERFQECFTRSENGRPPATDSEEVRALTAYVEWLSRGAAKGHAFPGRGLVKLPELAGNGVRGAAVYKEFCANCHGSDGTGVPPVLPPLWGADSFNDGAGMNNPQKLAAFVLHNMPQNHPAVLTPQQAFDVAEYIHGRPRPRFDQRYKAY